VKVALALVGGGLANSLIAYRILHRQPDFSLLVVDREPTLGANHTWSFHDSDLTAEQQDWMQPLVAQSWSHHELRFPRRRRVIEGGYNAVSSERLHQVVGEALGNRCLLGLEATEVAPNFVQLDDGTRIEADAVIDGRGDPGGQQLEVAFQKFLGLFFRLENRHRLTGPILMDATVEQQDGYRFVYTLPLSDHDLLVEDTYYSDVPDLDRGHLRHEILAYASHQGWTVADITGEETGVLPIVLGGNIDAFWDQGPSGVARSGMRAALFHPTTGYSLPEAVRLADEIALHRQLASADLCAMTKQRSQDLWRRCGFFRLLNRMLFRAAEPDQRYRVFQRFYGLPEDLIERFYAGRLEWMDKLRLLTGKPPLPVHRALRCLLERRRPAPVAATIESEETP
jgi:lycopene beta-cyclase